MSLNPYQEQMETASKTSKATTQENKPKKKKPTQPILATSLYLTFLSHQPQECKS